tara:strand:- start:129366 stop:131600 length:2235 start_codon:yes stop_codon:yes gene_type:complete
MSLQQKQKKMAPQQKGSHRMRFRYLLLILLAIIPIAAHAQGVFTVPTTDKSMQYLASIFGSMGSLPIQVSGDDSSVSITFRTLVERFNVIVFTLGIIIIAWTAMVSTISTAQEGEVMGKKFSSIWIPARMGFGMYFLLPSSGAGGYSLIQTAIMWMIVQGVGAANAIWKEIVTDPNSIHEDTRQATLAGQEGVITTLFQAALCMERINSEQYLRDQVGGESVTMFRSAEGDEVKVGLISGSGSTDPTELAKASMCGSFTLPSTAGPTSDGDSRLGSSGGGGLDIESRQTILADGLEQAFFALVPAALEALYPPSNGQYTTTNALVTAARALDAAMESLTTTHNYDDEKAQAIVQGWIHAGSYYFKIVGGMGGALGQSNSMSIASIAADEGTLDDTFGENNTITADIATKTNTYINEASRVVGTTNPYDNAAEPLGFNSSFSAGGAQSIVGAIFGDLFTDLALNMAETMTGTGNNTGAASGTPTQQPDDPVVTMSRFGTSVVNIVEAVFFAALLAAMLLWLASSIMHSMNPLGPMMDFVVGIVMSVAGLIISLLWVAGISLALYIPMIPYLVFTFSAITWIILVIEALLAAPLVGLTLVMPSEDELGKAGNGIVILLGLFLRPPLMILGFLLSVKLLMVAFTMLNYGFGATIKGSLQLGAIGLFGPVAIFTLYVGVAIALVHECFTLVYKLPDQVMRWIGSSSGGGDEMGKVKGMQGSVDKGAGVGKGAMSGGLKIAGDKAGVGK